MRMRRICLDSSGVGLRKEDERTIAMYNQNTQEIQVSVVAERYMQQSKQVLDWVFTAQEIHYFPFLYYSNGTLEVVVFETDIVFFYWDIVELLYS